MSLKLFQIVLLITVFSSIASAFDLNLTETNYLENTVIVSKIEMNIGNNVNPDSNIIVKVDNNETVRLQLKRLLELNQVRFNLSESRFLLMGNSIKTKSIIGNAFLGLRVTPGVVNDVEVIVSGTNANEPRIDVGNDQTDDWIFLGQSNSFNSAITGIGVNLQNEAGSFILATKDKFLCSLVDLPLTKDIKVEVKYKLSDISNTGGNISATLFSVSQDGVSAQGGSDNCDLPEPVNTNSEFRACSMKLSTVVKGKYYVCVGTKTDRPDGKDLYTIPIDDKPDSSFLCSGDVSSGELGCAKVQGGDFFIKISTGNYNKILDGNTNFNDWLVFPDSIKLAIQSQLINCNENCVVPINIKLNSGTFRIDKFRVRSSNFETDSMFDGSFENAKFSMINNINVTINTTNLSLSLSSLGLNTSNLSLGRHKLKIIIGSEEKEKEFSVATTTASEKFNSIKSNLENVGKKLEETLSKNQALLLKLNKKIDLETAINSVRLKVGELNSIINQTMPASEKDKKAEDALKSINDLVQTLPKLVIDRGKASDQQVVTLKDLEGLSNLDEKDLFFEQSKISGKIEMSVAEATNFKGEKELITIVNLEATANEDLDEANYLVRVPKNLKSLIRNKEDLNDNNGIKVLKRLNKGDKLKFEFIIDGNQINSFYDFKTIYLPSKIEPTIKSECGNRVCELPLENEFTCPKDCKREFPINLIVGLLVIALLVCLLVFEFTKENPPSIVVRIRSSFGSHKNSVIENYISNCLKKKVPEDQIRRALAAKGWKKEKIDIAFKKIKK